MDHAAGDECGNSGGWWAERLRVPTLGWWQLRLLLLLQRAVAATVAGASVAPTVAGGLYPRLSADAGRRRTLLRLILGAAKSADPAAAAPVVELSRG